MHNNLKNSQICLKQKKLKLITLKSNTQAHVIHNTSSPFNKQNAFLTLALEGYKCSVHTPAILHPGKQPSLTT
jgi:hypothetical protein